MNMTRFVIGVFLLVSLDLLGQTDSLEGFLQEQVALGLWSAHEAASVMHHIASFGLPVVPEEAGAIRGLRPESISALKDASAWVHLCTGVLGQVQTKPLRLIGSWTARAVIPHLDASLDKHLGQSIRLTKQGHWAVRLDRGLDSNHLEQIAGFVRFKNVRKKSLLVFGDHVLRWGMGLNVWDQNPFAGLNHSLEVLPSAHWLTPAWGSVSSQHRSGFAKTREIRAWRLASSVSIVGRVMKDTPTEPVQWRDLGWLEAKSMDGVRRIRELRMAQLVRHQLPWGSLGVVCEGGSFLHRDSLRSSFGWLGLHAEGHFNNVRWASETRHFDGEQAFRFTGLKNVGLNWDVYGSWEYQKRAHPAWRWNVSRSSPGKRFIWGGQKLASADSDWSGTWRAETWTSPNDPAERTLRFECKGAVLTNDVTQLQCRFQWQLSSDLSGWLSPNWRHSIRWQRAQEGMKIRIQALFASNSSALGGSGRGVLFWLEGKRVNWRWKVAASSWRAQDGVQLYGPELRLQGVGAQIMTGTGSRLSWWMWWQLTERVAIQWTGHTVVRSDRLSNSYLGFSTIGPVQTAMDFRLTVSL